MERVASWHPRRVSARVIAATNADVNAEAEAGRFRQDLLFRLNTIEIHLPPLRERRDDVQPLAVHFLRGYAQRYRKNLAGFEPAALEALLEHPWPGNVRELDHAVERGGLLSTGQFVRSSDLGLRPNPSSGTARLEHMRLEEVARPPIQPPFAPHRANASH